MQATSQGVFQGMVSDYKLIGDYDLIKFKQKIMKYACQENKENTYAQCARSCFPQMKIYSYYRIFFFAFPCKFKRSTSIKIYSEESSELDSENMKEVISEYYIPLLEKVVHSIPVSIYFTNLQT